MTGWRETLIRGTGSPSSEPHHILPESSTAHNDQEQPMLINVSEATENRKRTGCWVLPFSNVGLNFVDRLDHPRVANSGYFKSATPFLSGVIGLSCTRKGDSGVRVEMTRGTAAFADSRAGRPCGPEKHAYLPKSRRKRQIFPVIPKEHQLRGTVARHLHLQE